jgi:hypothetical protein
MFPLLNAAISGKRVNAGIFLTTAMDDPKQVVVEFIQGIKYNTDEKISNGFS